MHLPLSRISTLKYFGFMPSMLENSEPPFNNLMLIAALVVSVGLMTIFSLKMIPYLVGTYESSYSNGSH